MRAPLLTLLLKAASGVIVLGALAACTNTKNEPPSQVAAALPPPSTTAPAARDVMPALPSVVTGSFVDPINDTPDRVYFDYDKADLTPESMNALQKQAAWLQRYPTVTVVIEGHSDERGTREYNLALGARRATAVKTFLMTSGVNAARLETVSYGKERPSCITSGEECWHQNRRAVSTVKPAQ